MPPLVIADFETIENVDRLCEVVPFPNKTAAVNAAVKAMLLSRGVDVDAERRPSPQDAALVARLEGALRQATRDYVKLMEMETGKPSGSRIYQMLARRGAVDTVVRVVASPSEGLDFLADLEPPRLDLAFETIALSPEFRGLFSEAVLKQCEDNLAKARGPLANNQPRDSESRPGVES